MNKPGYKFGTIVLLVLVLVMAIFFRFYKITQTPPGLYPDEAVNGVNALEANRDHNWKVFYPENNGREGLFMNLQSVSIRFFGAQPWALRVVSGVFGVLTILGLFLLVRLLWGNRLAILASYLAAVSFWPVNFSRIGFRAVMLPFILVWAFYFLWLGLLKRKTWPIVLSGLVYGLGFHTYISWRVSPLLLVLMFLMFLFSRKMDKKFLLKSALVLLVFSVLVASLLLIYYLKNPADFMGRATQVSIFNSPSPTMALSESIIKTLGMFNVWGDGNWRHNLAGRPELFWPVGIGFLLGLIIALRKLNPKSYFLVFWFLVMLIPNFMAPEGAPHALRALGAMPAVFILAAVGLNYIYEKIQNYFNRALLDPANNPRLGQIKRIKKELAVLAVLFLIFTGVWEYRTYFVVWAGQAEVMSNFDQRLADIGNYLKLDSSQTKYVIVNENGALIKNIPVQAQPIIFLNFGSKNIIYLKADELNQPPARLSSAVIVPTKSDPEIISKLITKYPSAHLADFITFKALKIK